MRFETRLKPAGNSVAANASRLLIMALAVGAVAVLVGLLLRSPASDSSPPRVPPGDPGADRSPVAETVESIPIAAPLQTTANAVASDPPPDVNANPPGAVKPGILPRGEPTAEARQAVTALTQLDLSSGSITPTQAAVWKESLRALVAQGESAVPAIREFLEKNLDLSFGAVENGTSLGASSLRMALLGAMQEIGGEQATAGFLQTLQTSADPAELALVAAYLQKADPAQYRDSVLAAAHEALSMAASGKWDGRDVAPLFDVLKTFGGEEAARDLERYANTWFNYTPMVLAELPDGAGIPALIRLNSDGAVSLGQETYQRMLAQVSLQSPEASAALVQLAKAGKISATSWPAMADALLGVTLELTQLPVSGAPLPTGSARSYHIALGNQNYRERPPAADMSLEEVTQRIGLIDQVLGVVVDPRAVAPLQDARGKLAARL